ncbi:MAG: hypothetical protein PVI91_01500 [Gammaproteobacteria bacterium]|jgi:hypothetical protein
MDGEKWGIPFIESARNLAINVICAHRGISLGGLEYKYSHPVDIARAARRFPAVTFTITAVALDIASSVAGFGRRLYAVNARFGVPPTPDTESDVVSVFRH